MALPLRRLEGKYEIVRKLSEGGMGTIYRVRHRLLGDERVVKIMRPHLTSDTALRARFEREARAASRLSHPSIAQLYDFTIDEEGFAYIVMEYIQGMTLEELVIRESEIPLGLVLEIAEQSLAALAHLHAHAIVHRDVSPDNLMLSRDIDGKPRVKMIDLGIAKSLQQSEVALTATGMFVGKLRYASPEQFRDDGADVGPRSDLYSFGLVLYELLTGHYPITGEGATSIIAGHLFRPPLEFSETDPYGRIPGSLRECVLRSLAKRAGDRFENAEAMAEALRQERQPGDLELPAVRGILALTLEEPRGNLRTGPGTTQKRLDEHFTTQHRTPAPVVEPPSEGTSAARRRPHLKLVGEEGDPRLEDVLERLEEHVEAERLSEAREVLEEAQQLDGAAGDPRLTDLAERLHEKAKAVHRPRIQQLVREARALRTSGEPGRAVELLEEALELVPGDARLLDLLTETRQEVRQQALEARRGRQVEERATVISSLISQGDLSQAEKKLSEAGRALGRHSRWTELRKRLDEERQEREKRVAVLVREAESLVGRDLHEDAHAVLERALEIDPDNPDLLWRHAEVSGELRKRSAVRHHEEALAHVVKRIRRALEKGDHETARRRLVAAEATLGEAPALRRLRQQLADAMGISEQEIGPAGSPAAQELQTAEILVTPAPPPPTHRADLLVARARSLSQTEDWSGARQALREAVEIEPEHPEALELSRSLETLIALEAKQHRSLEERVREIRELLGKRRTGEAMKRLQEAIARFGDREELKSLRVETARAFLEDDTFGDDTYVSSVDPFSRDEREETYVEANGSAPGTAPPGMVPPETPAPGTPPVPPPASLRKTVAELTLANIPTQVPAAGEVPAAEVTDGQAETAVQGAADLGFGGLALEGDDEPAGEVALPPPPPVFDWTSPRLWILIVVLVIVFVWLGIRLAHLTSEPEAPAKPPPQQQIETEDVSGPKI